MRHLPKDTVQGPWYAPGTSPRYEFVDRLRVAAIFMIVLYHSPGGRVIPPQFQIGLASFFLLALTFRSRHPIALSPPGPMLTRARRVLLPYAFWWLVYAIPDILDCYRGERTLSWMFSPGRLVRGSALHLWFLPCLLAMEVLVSLLRGLTAKVPAAVRLALWAAGTTAFALYLRVPDWAQLGFSGWWFGIVGAFLGLVLSEILHLAGRRRMVVMIALAAVFFLLALLERSTGTPRTVVRYTVSLCLTCLAFSVPGRPDRVSRELTACVFGIYLLHPLVIHGIVFEAGLRHWSTIAVATTAFAISLLLTALLRRTPLRHVI